MNQTIEKPEPPLEFGRVDNYQRFARDLDLNPAEQRTRDDFLNIEAAELREGYE